MRVILDIKHPKDFEALIPLLKLLKISFSQQPDSIGKPDIKTTTSSISVSKQVNEAATMSNKITHLWDFNRFYGIAKSPLTLEQIDQQLNEHRKEWDRDIY